MLNKITNSHPATNGYIIHDSEAELARLVQQSELITKFEGGILPERENISGITKILDAGCGPGQWAVEVADQNPDIHVVGVDINKRMTDYARTYARRMGVSSTTCFLEMDITQPLDFPTGTFDLINARFLQSALTTDIWPQFVLECVRVVRSGGIVRFTESVLTESTSPEFQRLASLLPQALYKTHRSFLSDGGAYGITLTLSHLLSRAGCNPIQHRPFVINFSSGTDVYESMKQHLSLTYSPQILGDFIVRTGIISQERYLDTYNQAMNASGTSQFCGMGHLMTITGEKTSK